MLELKETWRENTNDRRSFTVDGDSQLLMKTDLGVDVEKDGKS
jgi:hypothetical protein